MCSLQGHETALMENSQLVWGFVVTLMCLWHTTTSHVEQERSVSLTNKSKGDARFCVISRQICGSVSILLFVLEGICQQRALLTESRWRLNSWHGSLFFCCHLYVQETSLYLFGDEKFPINIDINPPVSLLVSNIRSQLEVHTQNMGD